LQQAENDPTIAHRDLALFQHPPPHLTSDAPRLAAALQMVIDLCRDFSNGYLHMIGYEIFTQKVRVARTQQRPI
jgi:hypothetical protein